MRGMPLHGHRSRANYWCRPGFGVRGELHPPVRQVLHGRPPDELREALRQS